MKMKKPISILSLALAALVSPGCSLECTAVGCVENMSWSAELPTVFTFEDVRALGVRACRNDVCFERSFTEIEIDAPPVPGSSFAMQLAPSEAGAPSVMAQVTARSGGAYDVRVDWTDDVADGDTYAFEITDADGALVLERAPTAVEYEVSYPNGPDCDGECRTASLEGPTP